MSSSSPGLTVVTVGLCTAIPSNTFARGTSQLLFITTLLLLRLHSPPSPPPASSSSSSAAAAAASSSSSTSASASAQGAAALPEGWATAAAAETLREFGERKFYAADWFTAFSAHAITKRSGELPGRLLARFVIAVNDLQMLGLCHASKRPRGTIEKRVFG